MTFWPCRKNGSIREIMLISKSMTSQPGKPTIVIHILLNISRSKGNQTMKFGQLIEYNMRKIFVEKSYTKCAEETIPRPLSKISKLNISLDQQCKVLNSLFLLYANLRAIEIQWNQAADYLFLINIKLFKITKSGLELVSLHHFLHNS